MVQDRLPCHRGGLIAARRLLAAAVWTAAVWDGARADQELVAEDYPIEGAHGPDTYIADATLTTCTLLSPYPGVVPLDPSVAEAKTFCSGRPDCGGFLYLTPAASVAGGGSSFSSASYCTPQSFVSATASATSNIGYTRRLYRSCDVKATLPTSTVSFYGSIVGSRTACVRPGRALSPARDRSPRPNARRTRAPPKPLVQLGGVDYKVGEEAFLSAQAAQNLSVDSTSHHMTSASGIIYYMPGSTHATRDQSVRPIAIDGYYPLYHTESAGQAASSRGGGGGQAHAIGPRSSLLQPVRWTSGDPSQTYYMPSSGATLFYGDYVAPFELDGYYPLYRNQSDAQKASSNGLVQSHGPQSETGHPLSWSIGENRVFYMPAEGPQRYYGNYEVAMTEPDEPQPALFSSEAALRAARAAAGESSNQAAAAIAVYAGALPAYTTQIGGGLAR
mmetsp:Transcript_41739/g.88944  ORF Transcript_41739/g.88944 Transcript_41739/m.88944 type:complete len:446 (-) Transcript_41739:189-1526(-)